MTKTRQWSALTAVAVILVFAAGWFLLVKPQNSHASDLRAQAVTQQQSNQRLQAQIAQLQQEQKNLPQQQRALQKFSTKVPSDVSEPAILRQLSGAAAGSGVDLLSVTPGTATPLTPAAATGATELTPTPSTSTGGLVQLPLSLGVVGTFANLESFFQAMEKLPRATLVGGWSICPVSNSATATGSSSSSTGGASCTPPSVPNGKTEPAGSVGATISALVFYAPPSGAAGAAGATTAGGTTTTPATGTTTTTGSTPAPATTSTPATAATPAS